MVSDAILIGMAILGGLIAAVVFGGLAYSRAAQSPSNVRAVIGAAGAIGGMWVGYVLVNGLLG